MSNYWDDGYLDESYDDFDGDLYFETDYGVYDYWEEDIYESQMGEVGEYWGEESYDYRTAFPAYPSYPMMLGIFVGLAFFGFLIIQLAKDVGGPIAQQVDEKRTNENFGESCNVSEKFPVEILQWCDVITRYSNQNELSPDLIAALILQESGGNPQALSHSGAVGLMQVMPRDGIAATFNCVNGPCFSDRPTIAELRDPIFNVAFGTNFLADLFARSGSLREALRRYGPMDVGYSYADRVLDIYQSFRE